MPARRYRVEFDGTTYVVEVGDGRVRIIGENATFEVSGSEEAGALTVEVSGRKHRVEVEELGGGRALVAVDGRYHLVRLSEHLPSSGAGGREERANVVRAPLSGRVVKVYVRSGSRVRSGERLLVIESMKMENVVTAPRDGVVREVRVGEGSKVSKGDVVVVLE